MKTNQILIPVLIASLLLFSPICARTETEEAGEYQVKAAYLYHFAKFVEWPSEAAGGSAPTLTLCVLGKSPFGKALTTIAGKTVRGRPVVISYIKQVEESASCDMLFVSQSEKAKLAQILSFVGSRPILTVSDIKRFVSAGGMIGFVPEKDRIRFEINRGAALRSGLRGSAQLLKLAVTVVEP